MNSFTAVWRLARTMVRRDRLRLSLWLTVLPVLNYLFVGAFKAMYPNEAGMAARAALMDTPTGIIAGGPGYGMDHYTVGAMMLNEMTLYYEIALAIGLVLLAVRSTRGDEQSGRFELVASQVVGRYAPLTATLLVMTGLALGNGLLMSVSSIAAGLSVASSCAMSLGVGLSALAFAALATLAAQLAGAARAASGMTMAALALAFVLRAVGDVQRSHGSALSWLSPLAWTQQTRAYSDLRWWPLAYYPILILAIAVVALVLAARRDLGQGLLPPRPGPAQAPAWLASPLALAWRLQRATLAAWAVGALVLGLAVGPLMGDINAYIADNPAYADLLGLDVSSSSQISDGFIAVMLLYGALLGLWFAIGAIGRLREAETSGAIEQLLAGPLSRRRLLGAHCAVALVGALAINLVTALGLGATVPAASRPSGQSALGYVGDIFSASAAYGPAALATVGLAVALFGWAPRLAALNWAVMGYSVIAGMFGTALGLPTWAVKIAPLSATPRLPAEPVSWLTLAVLTAIAAGLPAAGLAGLKRRDIPAR
jgi:ABC-2 type transport system permease protein